MAERGQPEKPSGPGWYPDPWSADGKGERYFDGKHWGSTERPRGRHTTVDHTTDRNQIMFSESQFNVRDYSDGDRRGLAVMGTQPCVPEI